MIAQTIIILGTLFLGVFFLMILFYLTTRQNVKCRKETDPFTSKDSVMGSDILKGDAIKVLRFAQKELERCTNIFWEQARFFLTLNTAILGIAGLIFAYNPNPSFLTIISILGLFFCIIWLFHGNRISRYLQLTEESIIHMEDRIGVKVKRYQIEYLTEKKNLSILEKISALSLIKDLLPIGMIILWLCLIIFFAVLYHY